MRAFPILLLLLLTSTGQQQEFFPRIITIDGRLTRADYERRNGETFAASPVTPGLQRQQVAPRAGDWFSIVCRDGAGQATLISDPTYVRRAP